VFGFAKALLDRHSSGNSDWRMSITSLVCAPALREVKMRPLGAAQRQRLRG
jgi:hypothetical protein